MVEQKLTKNNLSGEKLLAILEQMARIGEPVRVQDLSEKMKMNASTLLRFLTTLVKCGYAAQDPESAKYYLTLKLCNLASSVTANISVRDIAHHYLVQLAKEFNESVCLSIEQNGMVVYIDSVQGPDSMLRTMNRIGSVAPMHCTGVGKLLLLDYSTNQLDELIEKKGLPTFTANTIGSKRQLQVELELVRRLGYSYDNEECEIGAKCIAAPIYDYTGKIVAGISITGPRIRMTNEHVEAHLPALISAAREISTQLGWQQQ